MPTAVSWFTDAECTKEFDFNTIADKNLLNINSTSHNLLLFAKWDTVTLKIAYDNVDEEYEGTTEYTVEQYPVVIADPTRTGYTFAGWTVKWNETDAEGNVTERSYDAGKNVQLTEKDWIKANFTFVANWQGKEVKLTFMNGSSIIRKDVARVGDEFAKVAPDVNFVKNMVIADPDKYLDANDLWIDAPETIEADSATTYQLKWKNIYTITFKYGTLTLKTLTGHETGIKEGMTVPAAAPAVTDENGNAPTKWLIKGTDTII